MIEAVEKEHMLEGQHIVKKTHKGEIDMDEDLSTLEVNLLLEHVQLLYILCVLSKSPPVCIGFCTEKNIDIYIIIHIT